ncbi:hypothetical protein D3S83_20695, partial [Shigella sonnei]|nr:hypothetical protein [Shigella sonnei]
MLQLIAKSGRGRAPKPIAEALAGGRSLDEFLIEVSVLVFLVIILMLHLRTASLLSECSEYR